MRFMIRQRRLSSDERVAHARTMTYACCDVPLDNPMTVEDALENADPEEVAAVASSLTQPQPQSQLSGKKRRYSKLLCRFDDKRVCAAAFTAIFGVSQSALTSTRAAVASGSVSPQAPGRTGRTGLSGAVGRKQIRFLSFLLEYASDKGRPSPSGRGGIFRLRTSASRAFEKLYDGTQPKPVMLPAGVTKLKVYTAFKALYAEDPSVNLTYEYATRLWSTYAPHILLSSPATDYCSICLDFLLENLGEEQTQKYEDHRAESRFWFADYLADCRTSRAALVELHRTLRGLRDRGRSQALTRGIRQRLMIHLTIDAMEDKRLPWWERTPGFAYYLSQHKVCIYMIMNDTLHHQDNYCGSETEVFSRSQLVDYSKKTPPVTIKNPAGVISMLHHNLGHRCPQCHAITIHADNCAGQVKNRWMLMYCAWRVATGLNEEVHLKFCVKGHTRNSADAAAGVIGRKLRSVKNITLPSDLRRVIDSCEGNSAVDCNVVDWRDWKTFLEQFYCTVPGLSTGRHFRFTRGDGEVRLDVRVNRGGAFSRHFIRKPVARGREERIPSTTVRHPASHGGLLPLHHNKLQLQHRKPPEKRLAYIRKTLLLKAGGGKNAVYPTSRLEEARNELLPAALYAREERFSDAELAAQATGGAVDDAAALGEATAAANTLEDERVQSIKEAQRIEEERNRREARRGKRKGRRQGRRKGTWTR